MSQNWNVSTVRASHQSDEDLKNAFGEDVIVSRIGPFNLIHLDNPSPEVVESRIAEFDPDELFEDDCPLCKMLREEGGNVVYDEFL
jgi:hypothetical protein